MLFTTTWAARGLPFSPSWGDKWPAHAYQAPESLDLIRGTLAYWQLGRWGLD